MAVNMTKQIEKKIKSNPLLKKEYELNNLIIISYPFTCVDVVTSCFLEDGKRYRDKIINQLKKLGFFYSQGYYHLSEPKINFDGIYAQLLF
jgi:hypothetical protein